MLNLCDYISNSQMYKKFKVNELLFTVYDCLAEESRLGIWSPHNYFAYILSGKKIWKTPEKEYLVGPGDSIFIKKGAHIAYQIFEDDFCVLFIFVPDEFIKNVVQSYQVQLPEMKYHENSDTVIPLDVNDILSAYYQSVLTYFSQSNPPPTYLLEIKFKELIINVLSSRHNPLLAGYFKNLCCHAKISISDTMQSNFTYHLQLEEFAKLCGRSLSTFKRDFVNTYGIPPGKWLTKRRLDYGKYLLETTDKCINEIAFDSGFENTSHFIRVFKDKFGAPPLHYKKH